MTAVLEPIAVQPSNRKGDTILGAREKLNRVAVVGNLLIAGFAGLIFDSWLIFLIVGGLLMAVSLHDGNIRPTPRWR